MHQIFLYQILKNAEELNKTHPMNIVNKLGGVNICLYKVTVVCKNCLCEKLRITKEDYSEKVKEFREQGCNLF